MTEKYPYVTKLDVKYDHFELIDVPALVRSCTDKWFNQTLTEVNDSDRQDRHRSRRVSRAQA